MYASRSLTCLTLLWIVPSATADDGPPPGGTVIAHNADPASDPPGSGQVDVLFEYNPASVFGPLRAVYSELATLTVEFAYPQIEDPFLWARSYVFNETDVPWTGFIILLEDADFTGGDFSLLIQAPAVDPVIDLGIGIHPELTPEEIALGHTVDSEFSLLSSEITRFNDHPAGFRDARLTVLFDDPVDPQKGFNLHYNIIPSPGAADPTAFTIHLTPIPEPASALLLTVAAALLTTRPRRHKKTRR